MFRLFKKKDRSVKGYEIIYKDWKYPYLESVAVGPDEHISTIQQLQKKGFEVLRIDTIQ